MPEHELRFRRATRTANLLISFLAWWTVTAWLARIVSERAIALTSVFVAVGILACYAIGWSIVIVWSGRRRLMIFRAVATTFVLSVLLAIVEIPAAFGVVDYSELWSRLIGEWAGPSTNYETDFDLGFRHPPHTRWSGRPRSDMAVYWNLPVRRAGAMTFSTDSRGFRNLREMQTADVVLLGDSYVEGAYNSDDETCAVVLERLTGAQVANLALAGYGTLQQFEVLARYAVPMKPRMIAWFFFEGNDLYDDEGFEGSLPYLRERKPFDTGGWRRGWGDFRDRSFTVTTFRLLRRFLDPIAPNTVATSGTYRDAGGVDHRMYYYSYGSLHFDDYERERFEKSKAAFRRGKELCDENGIELVLFYVPMKFRVYGELCTFPPGSPCRDWKPWNLAEHFREFCEQESLAFVDLTEPMKHEAAAGKLLYAPEDSHWNVQGHEFVARKLQEQWERLGQGK